MNITGLFIRRPVTTALIMLAILAFGLLGYRDLAVSDLPNVDFPTIQVSAGLSGASPDTMASAVATPLEKQFTTIAGLDSMTSTSSLGSTQITLQFDLSRNIDSAALDVQSAITSAANQLPPNMPSPPTFRKVNPADSPILFLALTSTTLPLSTVDEYAETLLGQQISMVPGVAQVGVFGSMKYAVRIQVNPAQLAARRIGIDEVLQSIQSANVNMPMGTLYGAHNAFNIQSNGQLTDAALFRPLIVAYRNGAPVRLDEVATVSDSVQDNRQAGWINAEPGIILAVQRQPGTNTIAIVDAIRKLLPRFRSIMPPAMHLSIEYDRSISIRQSVNDVKFTLFLAICLVVLVIFLFLRNLSATVIPSLALADGHHRNLRGDVPARLHHRQSVPARADAVGGLRRRRRHRHARKHRAAHGAGQGRRGGGVRRLEGNRFHHYLDDPGAGRGLPAGLLHGRDSRPAAPRIRRGHHFRRAGFGCCFADPHPDALQPLPARGARARARVDVPQPGERARNGPAPLRRHASLGAASSRRGDALRGPDSGRHGLGILGDSQGLPSRGRHVPNRHFLRGAPRHLVRRDESESGSAQPDHPRRSQHAPILLPDQRLQQHRPQQRPRQRPPEGAFRPSVDGQPRL